MMSKNVARLAGASMFLGMLLPFSAHASLKVFTCVPEWEALVKAIGGDKVTISNATPSNVDPDEIKPLPSMVTDLQQADLLVCTGLGLSDGIDELLDRAQNPKLAAGQPGNFEAGSFVDVMPVSKDPLPGAVAPAHEAHAEGNPHIFSDPHNVIKVAAQLAKRMAAIDPDDAQTYTDNAKAFIREMTALTKELEQKAAPLKGVNVAVTHVHSDYLLRWLGINTASIFESETSIPPGPERLAQIIGGVQPKGIKMVIYVAYENPALAKFVAEKAQIPAVKLPFTLGGTEAAKDYPGFFRDSVDRLLDGLAGKSRD